MKKSTGTRVSGDGKQDWGTPREFVDAVERQFQARMDFDLAATAANTIVKREFFTPEDDALTKSWKGIGKNLWLNPPFSAGEAFAKKCWEEAKHLNPDQRIFLLSRGSISTKWYAKWVHGSAMVYAIIPRLKFVGAEAGYNAELVLAVFHPGRKPSGFWHWTWNDADSGPKKA
jgi:phage N-6-adenine-methyltransferase